MEEILDNSGKTIIADDVVATIVGMAINEINGIASMSGNFVGNITETFGVKDPKKGVKVDVKDNTANIDVHINVTLGTCIPDVSKEIRNKIKELVGSMTGLTVNEVNIYVDGIAYEKKRKDMKDKESVESAEICDEPTDKQI